MQPARTPAAPAAPPGISDYELVRLVGRGSYGDVWLARGVTGVFRAIKIVWRDRFPDPQPFEREFRGLKEFAAVSLLEPRQLALLHVGRNPDAGYFYYVMELADDAETGREIDPARYVPNTLREVRRRRGRLPAAECVALGVELARALAGLHGRGLVHRDIKPSNIILAGGAPKLADIGLVASASAALTFVGTEGYVPPEGPGAPSADVFSLGKLLYELATGLDRNDYPRLPPHLASLPDAKALLEFNEVLIRACERDAAKRHRDATALLDDLLLLQAGRSVRRLRNAERRLARSLRVAALLALVAGVAATGAWIEHHRAARAEAERDEIARRTVYSANLTRAQRAIERDDLSRARQFLRESLPSPGVPDLRGFEWHALWHAAQDDPHLVLRDGGPAIDRIALSPDESLLAAHAVDGTLALHDVASRGEKRRIGGVAQFAGFSPDGAWLLGTDNAGRLNRWSVRDGAGFIFGPPGTPRPLGATHDAELVALDASAPAALVVWDFLADRELRRIPLVATGEAPGWVVFRHTAIAPGGAALWAEQRGSGSTAVYRVTLVPSGPASSAAPIRFALEAVRPGAVGFDATGPWVAAEASGAVWHFRDGAWTPDAAKFPIGLRKYLEAAGAHFAAQGRSVVRLAASERGAVAGRAHTGLVTDLAVAARAQIVFSGATDGALFGWRLDAFGPPPTQLAAWNFNAGSARLAFSPDGATLLAPQDGQTVVGLAVPSLQPRWRADRVQFATAASARGVLGIAPDRGLVWLDATTGARRADVPAGDRRIRLAATSASGDQIAAIDYDGDLLALGADAVPRRLRSQCQRQIVLLLNRSGTRLWTTSADRELLCLSWPDGREIWRETLVALAPNLLLLPEREQLLVALENGRFEVRDAGRGTRLHVVDAESAAPQDLAATPDGTRVFAAGIEGDIHCFDTNGWRYLHSLPLHTSERLHVLVCSPDGRTLAALTKTGTLHLIRRD